MTPQTKRVIRTAIQTLLAVVAVLPALAATVASSDSLATSAPWLVAAAGTAAAVAAGVARLMAIPAVERLLARLGIGTDGGGSA